MATRAHHTLAPWSEVKAELHDLPLAIRKKHPARTNPKSAPFNTAANSKVGHVPDSRKKRRSNPYGAGGGFVLLGIRSLTNFDKALGSEG